METLVNTSKIMPMGNNILVDRKKVMELVDQLRLQIPQEVKSAEEVLVQKDQIINHAMVEARRAKLRAEDEFREKLNQNELRKRADDMIREWTEIYADIRSEREGRTYAPGECWSAQRPLCVAATMEAARESFERVA